MVRRRLRVMHVARRPQPVAIERAQRVAPVGQHHAGRPVPRLHVHRVVLVEGAQVGIERIQPVPGRRNQQAHGVQQVEPAHEQHLEHVVEALRVRAGERYQRQHLLQLRQQRGAQQRAARRGPVAVALDGVDLAVVRQIAVRVREAPLRQGVGREALVEHRHRARQARVGEVGVELRQVLRHHHALVDDGAGGQARHVEGRVRLAGALGEAPRHEQAAVEGGLVELHRRAVDEQLLDARQRLQGLGTAGLDPDRHHAPAGHLQPLARQRRPQRGPAGGGQRGIVRQEHQPRGEAWGEREAGLGGHRAQEFLGTLQQQSAAVAGLAVGGDGAAVRQAIEGGDRGAHQPVARRVVEARDQAEAAAVALVGALVESG